MSIGVRVSGAYVVAVRQPRYWDPPVKQTSQCLNPVQLLVSPEQGFLILIDLLVSSLLVGGVWKETA